MSEKSSSQFRTRAREERAPGQETRPDRTRGERVDGWLRDSAISGFFATFAFTAALAAGYGLARAIGQEGGNQLQRWIWALTNNPVVESTEARMTIAITLNLAAGLGFAMIYGRFAEPLLPGRSIIKGMLFSLVPFILSITVFFPIMDAGFLGADIGAGPLPVLGNLIVHLAYGAVLGWIFGLAFESGIDDSPLDRAANEGAERGAARGVPLGAILGGAAAWIVSPTLDDMTNQLMVTVIGALTGGAVGLLVGSLIGMGNLGDEEEWTEA